MHFIKKPNDGACRDQWGRLVPGGYSKRYQTYWTEPSKGWKTWLVKELSKVPGGMDGLIKTDNGYTNKAVNVEVTPQ